MTQSPVQTYFFPFVYIVDSPSSQDLFNGYSIGMALRDALDAIRIPCIYTLATNKQTFEQALQQKLQSSIFQYQTSPSVNAYPFIHLCMHGANEGIALTDNSYLNWSELRKNLFYHNQIKGYDPMVCMASCNGINGASMAHAYDSVFNVLIGNTDAVLQSDVTVAYLAFYNQIFNKNATLDQAIAAMRNATGDHNFYYSVGQQIKNQKLKEIIDQNTQPLSIIPFTMTNN
ncbi:hypothetical protein [Acinetobacter baumannii]|uniref:hypothetical protein n=1 Tax=Acinetobacter baumannii TaxID=470 RepID=UPI0009341060|nr:hypothetical protein [Acinetobacter baumannii]